MALNGIQCAETKMFINLVTFQEYINKVQLKALQKTANNLKQISSLDFWCGLTATKISLSLVLFHPPPTTHIFF